jgi:hypothetical protein
MSAAGDEPAGPGGLIARRRGYGFVVESVNVSVFE